MSQDPFRKAEDEYFRLKGQLAARRINHAQFEAALQDLMLQDEQGRYWMLGVETGKWYVHDGKSWVLNEPGSPAPPSSSIQSKPSASPNETAGATHGSSLKIVALALGVMICLGLSLVALYVFSSNPDFQRLVLGVRPTSPLVLAPTLPPITGAPFATSTSIPIVIPTLAPSQTPSLTPSITPTPTFTPRPEGNCSDPGAQWENITDGQRIDPYAAMQGTANAPDFEHYQVEYLRPGNVLHRSNTPVIHNVLFVWNTYTVANGDYPLALIVYLKDGSFLAPCVIRVRVQH